MRSLPLAAFAALLFLAGCGQDPVAPDPLDGPLTGQWSVRGHASVLVEVGVAAPGVGVLAGCIQVGFDTISRPQDRVQVAMLGSLARHALTLNPAADQRQLWTFTGTRQAVDTLVGTGRLDGGPLTSVVLVRIAPAPDC